MSQEGEKPFVFPVMKTHIQTLFQAGTPSFEALRNFQEHYWEQLVPNFNHALRLLDIHGVSRHSLLWSINDRLLDAVKTRIQEKSANNGSREVQKLWQRVVRTGIPYITHPYMQGTIMKVMGLMDNIKHRHMSVIIRDEDLYKNAPLSVLRHIWMSNHDKFREEVMEVLHAFQSSMSEVLLDPLFASVTSSSADRLPLLYWPPRRRRKDSSITKIVEMVGDNQTLYERVLEILREESTKYQQMMCKTATRKTTLSSSSTSESTKPGKGAHKKEEPAVTYHHLFISPALLSSSQAQAESLLCTFRFDLLMSFIAPKLESICSVDPVHHFVWCMDACIKGKLIDRRHANELAKHLHRKAAAASSSQGAVPASEVGLDQDTSEDWAPGLEERRRKSIRAPRAGEKRSLAAAATEEDEEAAGSDAEEAGASASSSSSSSKSDFERDLQIVLRDPWAVYTICSTLLKIVITGLYEDKTPRNIPEVPFLVHLLMRGLKADLTPPEVATTTTSKAPEAPPKSKRARRNTNLQAALAEETQAPPPMSPEVALLTQVLPAAAQLHLRIWRNQVYEEARATAARVWSPAAVAAATATATSPEPPKETPGPIPPAWKRRLEGAQPLPVSVPPSYLAHPVGHLFLQYHALFALERRDWLVLRALLKAASAAAQVRPPKVTSPTPPRGGHHKPTNQLTIGFRWRPECLQAVALGIASLPEDSSYKNTSSSSPSSAKLESEQSLLSDSVETGGAKLGTTSPPPNGASLTSAGANPGGAGSLVTRAELACLLRTSLPLQSDLQLLVLAQCARLVSGAPTTPTTPLSAPTATPMPNFFGLGEGSATTATPRGVSERERMVNALGRHVEVVPAPSEAAAGAEGLASPMAQAQQTPAVAAGFKSSNPKVAEALEYLRRDLERPLTSGISVLGSTKASAGGLATKLMPPPTPLLQHASRLMPPPPPYARFATPRPAQRFSAATSFPMATPLTNPGLATPSANRFMPSSPPPEYRPPSPPITASAAMGYQTYATPAAAAIAEPAGYSRHDLKRYAAPMEPHSPPPPSSPTS